MSRRTRRITIAWPATIGGAVVVLAVGLGAAAFLSGPPATQAVGVATTAALAAPSVLLGVLLLIRRPRLWTGAQLSAVGSVPFITAAWSLPPVLADTVWRAIPSAISWPLWFIAPMLLTFTFPDGHALTPRWRPVLWAVPLVSAASVASVLLSASEWTYSGLRPPPLPPEAVSSALSTALLICLLALIAVAVVSVVLRYRRGDAVTRLQVRWLATGFMLVPIGMSAALSSVAVTGDAALVGSIFIAAIGLALPLAVWIAVTRHGLYEIGRVVSRTVSYTIVTALVIGVYAVVVTSTTWLLPELSTLGVALATLAAAALFFPVLRFVQRRIDRRFDREHFDAQKTVDAFGEHLRTGTDPSTAAADLADAVERTLQPSSLGLWTAGAQR
ncbi:hypothetical protein SAMN04487751_2303 [Microbacterium saccharophilum]|jgi:hypothetical protein|uniref:Uncharacterized protein n=2 Tax=Microbacteriaceae TaxID=85023 RepID=A0A7Z7D0N7_9MICO|nr:hypothetical protein SAMN04487751_2303 [Microbacterium saccharophilum]